MTSPSSAMRPYAGDPFVPLPYLPARTFAGKVKYASTGVVRQDSGPLSGPESYNYKRFARYQRSPRVNSRHAGGVSWREAVTVGAGQVFVGLSMAALGATRLDSLGVAP
jgi:hypothetical protein